MQSKSKVENVMCDDSWTVMIMMTITITMMMMMMMMIMMVMIATMMTTMPLKVQEATDTGVYKQDKRREQQREREDLERS